MKTFVAVVLAGVVTVAGIGVPRAWAESTIVLSRDDSTPKTLRIKPGDDVRFINSTGGRPSCGSRTGSDCSWSPAGAG